VTGLVVDSSAIVAILHGETGARDLGLALEGVDERFITAATHVEVLMVVESRGRDAATELYRRLVESAEIEVRAVDKRLADDAIAAWRRFGKGRHRAALNFGDCFVYALAEATGYPILCTGNDFAQTDLEVVPAR
jgi:ribonuclease VapC